MRKFSINCDFGGQMAPFDIFIGQPEPKHHPLHFQADWLLKQRGGTILPEVMDAIAKLNDLALENGVPLEDLCVYALGSAQDENTTSDNKESSDTNETTDNETNATSDVEESIEIEPNTEVQSDIETLQTPLEVDEVEELKPETDRIMQEEAQDDSQNNDSSQNENK